MCVFGALVATVPTALSADPLFQFQGFIFMTAFVLGAYDLLPGITSGSLVPQPDKYMDGVVRAGVIATLFWGAAGMLVGPRLRR